MNFFQLQGNQREMSELRANNQILAERLESLSRSYSSSSPSSVQMSLLNEMEMSASGSDSDRSLYTAKRLVILHLIKQSEEVNNVSIFRPCSQIEEEIEDIDNPNDDSEMTCISSLEHKQVRATSGILQIHAKTFH